jgi:predicted deacylase
MRPVRLHTLFALLLALPLAAIAGALGLAAPTVAHATSISELTIGVSGEGRPITAVRFGDGPRKLVVVSDTHGGPEANTYALALELIDHFRAHPEQVPPGVRLYIIPTANPDGLAIGTRFNARGVDLNRNMNTNLDACPENDWNNQVQGAYGVVSDTGGPYADSEVESRLVRDFLLDASGAIFIHSNAGLVFPAFCQHEASIQLGEVYAGAAGYEYSRYWPRYMITGGMHDWASSLGIAAITPELVTGDNSEFAANLAGLQAVLERAEALLPLPEDRAEGGVTLPALIWRYWRSHGGEAAFGLPLAPAALEGGQLAQRFARATLVLHADEADTPGLVQPAPLGRALAPASADAERFFAPGEHAVVDAFADYWQRASGDETLGPAISDEFSARAADGVVRPMQFFERGALAYYPEHADTPLAVQPEPLGWVAQQRAGVFAPGQAHQVR